MDLSSWKTQRFYILCSTFHAAVWTESQDFQCLIEPSGQKSAFLSPRIPSLHFWPMWNFTFHSSSAIHFKRCF